MKEAGTGVGGRGDGLRVTGGSTGASTGCADACGTTVVGSAAEIGFTGVGVVGGTMICGDSPGWRYHSGALYTGPVQSSSSGLPPEPCSPLISRPSRPPGAFGPRRYDTASYCGNRAVQH